MIDDGSLSTGQAAALSAALLWAVAMMMFRGPISSHGARTINLAKCLLAAVLQGATVVALGQASTLVAAPPLFLGYLVASGFIALGLGDTALFAAVSRIGVHRTLLLQTLTPVFAAVIAVMWRGELPTTRQGLGAAVILAGVAIVVAPSRREAPSADGARPTPSGADPMSLGILLGTLAALLQGIGIVLAKVGMEEVPAMSASVIRLAAATGGLIVLGFIQGHRGGLLRLLEDRHALRRVLPATVLGTYLAMFLYMIGIALAPASIAATLLSTSPIFSLLLEIFVEKRPPTARGIAGTLTAVAGVAIVTL